MSENFWEIQCLNLEGYYAMFPLLPSPDPDIISDPDIWWVTRCLPNRDRDCIFVSAQEGNNLSVSQMLEIYSQFTVLFWALHEHYIASNENIFMYNFYVKGTF